MELAIKTFVISIIVCYFKWIVIILIYPFQCLYVNYKINNKKNKILKFLCAPYIIFEDLLHWGWQRYMLYEISTLPSHHIRKWIYKGLGAKIGPNVVFHYKTELRNPTNLIVGGGTIIGDNALLDARNCIFLGENVNISSNVSIYTEQHNYRDPEFRSIDDYDKTVYIGNRVWLGSNVIVLPGVSIGEGAVCCAGCVVTKDVEPYSVVAGIPAKKVRERPKELQYIFTGKSNRLI